MKIEIRPWHVFLVLCSLGSVIYSSALYGPFVFDDRPYVSENPWIRDLGNFIVPTGMRYIGDLSFALNYALGGTDPSRFRAVNIAVHIINSFLVFLFVKALFDTPFFKKGFAGLGKEPLAIAFMTSVIFVAHPIETQAVTYISQRYTSLAALFYISAVLAYISARLAYGDGKALKGRTLYILAMISALLAMKTKEISFTLPFLILFFELALFYPERVTLKRLAAVVPFMAAALIIPASLLMGGGSPVEELMRARKLREAVNISSYNYLITQSMAVMDYLKLLFYPSNQHFAWHYPLASSVLQPKVLASSIAVLSSMAFTGILLFRSVRGGRPYGLMAASGMVWFFITLSVESSIIPIRDAFNEHRLYLPSVGVIFSFVSTVFFLKGRLVDEKGRFAQPYVLVAAFLALVVLPLSIASYSRNAVWSDPVRLYRDEAAKNPSSASPRMYLGITYFESGMADEALAEFKKAEELEPSWPFVHKTLAKVYLQAGDYDGSIKELEAAVRLDGSDIESSYNLSMLYIRKKRFDEAERELLKAAGKGRGTKLGKMSIEKLNELRKMAGD